MLRGGWTWNNIKKSKYHAKRQSSHKEFRSRLTELSCYMTGSDHEHQLMGYN